MGINIPPEALEAAARAMAKAGYGFTGIELTDPYTADAEYWDTVARAACLAMLKHWPGMSDIPSCEADGTRYPRVIHLPINTENTDAEA